MKRLLCSFVALGLLTGGLLVASTDAQTLYVQRPLWGPDTMSYRVAPGTMAQLRSELEYARELEKRTDAAWDRIKDACKGKGHMFVTPQQCAETRAAEKRADALYAQAQRNYGMVRNPLIYDPYVRPGVSLGIRF
jgi:hypothetical protein